MPNWCSTTIKFEGEPSAIKDFHEKITIYTDKSFVKTDFGDSWLGNVLYGFNMEDHIDNNDPTLNIRCRGEISGIDYIVDINENTSTLMIYTETAWRPMIKMWTEIIRKHYDNAINIYWLAEESGNCVYETNSIAHFPNERYFIELCYNDDWSTEYAATEEDALEIINDFLEKSNLPTDGNLEDFRNFEYEEDYKSVYIYLHELEDVSNEDVD